MNKVINITYALTLATSLLSAKSPSQSKEADIIIAQLVKMIENQTYYYVGANYAFIKVHNEKRDNKVVGQALGMLAGYKFHPFVSVEARYTSSLGQVRAHNTDNDWRLSNLALFLKPQYNYENIHAYALLGLGMSSYDNGKSHSESGIQWGFGTSVEVFDDIDFFIDYSKLYAGEGYDGIDPKHDFSMYSVNIGVSYRY